MAVAGRTAGVLVLVACAALSDGALAQAPAEEEPSSQGAAAKELFDEGLDGMLDKDFERGCAALEKSYQLEPLPGVGFTAGECFYRWGKLAAAQRHLEWFRERFDQMPAKEQAEQEHRMEVAAKRLEELAQRVPLLTVQLPASAPEGTVVLHNGTELPAEELGSPRAHEVGRHTFLVRLPSGEERERGLLAQEGDRRIITLDLPLPGAQPSTDPAEIEDAEADDEADGEPWLTGDQMRWIAYGLGGFGAANLIISAVTGGLVFSEKSTMEDNCIDFRCNAEGFDAAESAQSLATVSTVSLIIGLAALGGGAALWLLAPSDEEAESSSPDVAVGGGITPMGGAVTVTARF
jgi:hypothetical protein